MKIDLKIIDDRIGDEYPIPQYAKSGDAGVDLRAMIDEPITLYPGETSLVPTGISVSMPEKDMVGFVLPRSGLGVQGLVLGNSTGVIDSGYVGEIKLSLWNRNKVKYRYAWSTRRIFENRTNVDPITINPGDRIAQMVFLPIIRAEFNIVSELADTERGDGGFESSGRNEIIEETSEDSQVIDDITDTNDDSEETKDE